MKKITLLVIILASINSFAQKKVGLIVRSVNEYRDRGSSVSGNYIRINCYIDEMEINENQPVKIDEITFAEDDLGRKLNKPVRISYAKKFSSYNLSIYLSGTTRDAKSIKKIKGKFFQVSSGEKSTINLENFLSNNSIGKNLVAKKTKNAQVILLSKEILKKIEALDQETLAPFIDAKIIADASSTSVSKFIKNLASSSNTLQQTLNLSGYGFYINDPDKEIISIQMMDNNGEKSGYAYMSSSRYKFNYMKKSKESFNTSTLVIKIATKGNTKKYKFELEDIILP
ncbi:hypothetical protein [Polaribacter sp.]|uniref:hypothetical protein n=1 Tax=Polaribacter sp. TaxID=1920175 RepID=UPI003EF7BEB0